MRTVLVLLAALAITACDLPGTAGAPSPGPSLSTAAATPTPRVDPLARYAVMVHRAGLGEPYLVQLVGFDGRGGPWVQAVSRSAKTFFFSSPCPPGARCPDSETAAYSMPETSISRSHVYFLDGETQIKSLARDGMVRSVKDVDAPPNSQVVFSVSPDDRLLAVAVITLATSHQVDWSFHEIMYVEGLPNLPTPSRRVLYDSTIRAEWPVGWHAGNIVVAAGTPDIASYDNRPYGATDFLVIDPPTNTLVSQLECSRGLLVPAGTVCVTGGCPTTTSCTPSTLTRVDWDRTRTEFNVPADSARRILVAFSGPHLSPEGSRVAAELVTDPATGAVETAVFTTGTVLFTSLVGAPQGWLDDYHLVISNPSQVVVVDLATGTFTPMQGLVSIPQQGMPMLTGILPGDL